MTTELVIGGAIKGESLSDATTLQERMSSSNTVVLRVELGQTVWIRSSTAETHTGELCGFDFATFSGWKLF